MSEIADARAPYLARGCPFQAWSLAEALRLEFDVLAEPTARTDALAGLEYALVEALAQPRGFSVISCALERGAYSDLLRDFRFFGTHHVNVFHFYQCR